jgi:restriction system protein
MKNSEQDPATKRFIRDLYDFFDDPFDFERFIRELLERMGLDEVQVTQRSRDGGVDVTAIRPGVEGLSSSDSVRYLVQAKRYKPGRTVPARTVRELRGSLDSNQVGILATTAKFTKDAIAEADGFTDRHVILIDGADIARLCVKHGLGVDVLPAFNRDKLTRALETPPPTTLNEKQVLNQGSGAAQASSLAQPDEGKEVVKLVTNNDIKKRILRLPVALHQLLPPDAKTVRLRIPGQASPKKRNYINDRRMITGLTADYRQLGLLDTQNNPAPERVSIRVGHKGNEVWLDFADR